MTQGLFWAVFAGYLSGWALIFINFETERDALYALGRRILLVSFAAHWVWVAHLCVGTDAPRSILWQSTIPVVIIGITLLTEWRTRVRFLLLFSLPIVLLLSVLLGKGLSSDADSSLSGGWLKFHLGFILAGLAGFIVSVSAALMYLWQSAQLKSRHPGQPFLKLPPLATLDRLHFRALVWGVVFFSVGIAAGVVWARDLRELGSVLRDPKAVLSFLSCAMYWGIVSLRLSALRRGQKIAIGTLAVFLLLFLAIGSTHVAPGAIHGGR